MDGAVFGLAIIPPILAMAVERFNPLTEHRAKTSAEADLHQFQAATLNNYNILVERVTFSTLAAIEVAGLAPTLVSAVTSGFAILHEIPNPFWYTIVYVIFFITITLVLLNLLAGRSFYEIQTTKPTYKRKGRPKVIGQTRSGIVSATIYVANIALVLLAVSTYLVLGGAHEVVESVKSIYHLLSSII
jgi:hypothetical protein